MIFIPDDLWINIENRDKNYDVIKDYYEKDDFIEGDESEAVASLIKALKDEPLVLEYIGIY